MKIKIYAVDMDGCSRFLGTCLTDNIGRALQMYDGELMETERLEFKIIESKEGAK